MVLGVLCSGAVMRLTSTRAWTANGSADAVRPFPDAAFLGLRAFPVAMKRQVALVWRRRRSLLNIKRP